MTAVMSISELLGDMPAAEFVREYFLKLPFSRVGGCLGLTQCGSWQTVHGIVERGGADLMVVKRGRRWPESRTPAFDELRALHGDGHTIVIRHAERHDEQIGALAQEFVAEFGGAVDAHLYCTPADQFGFGWHYDAEDVFILQCEGSKQYSLRKNTVNPWPLLEAMPADLRYEREIMPLLRCTLNAGDWLYIPAGYWHRADSQQDSISLAMGLLTPAAIDVFDFLRGRLLASLRWRQRLPSPGAASGSPTEDIEQQYQELFADLGRDLALVMRDPKLAADFLAARRAANAPAAAGAATGPRPTGVSH